MELLESFNYDLALKNAKKLKDESIKTYLLGFDALINNNFLKNQKNTFENETSVVGKMAYFLSSRKLDKNSKIPEEIKKYEAFVEKYEYNSSRILSRNVCYLLIMN